MSPSGANWTLWIHLTLFNQLKTHIKYWTNEYSSAVRLVSDQLSTNHDCENGPPRVMVHSNSYVGIDHILGHSGLFDKLVGGVFLRRHFIDVPGWFRCSPFLLDLDSYE